MITPNNTISIFILLAPCPHRQRKNNQISKFRHYESQLILYGGARRVLEQTGINLKGLNVDKLKAEYQELLKQKNDVYRNCA